MIDEKVLTYKATLEQRRNHAAKFNPASYFPTIHARRPSVVSPAAQCWAARVTTKKTHSSLRFENGGAAFNRAPLNKLNKFKAALSLAMLTLAPRDPNVESPKIQTA